jgi:CDP-glucose 4,6-dehydratase
MNGVFWKGRRVFLTGHTGFKGAWLSLWLQSLGAEVTGYALEPPSAPSLFELAGVARGMRSILGDVRDARRLAEELRAASPEVVLHLAAQPLVRESYRDPAGTFAVNVMGTVNLLEAVRACPGVRAVVNVTTDKCYENREWVWGYRECDALGGHDPYASSKACSELATAAWRASFFSGAAAPGVATARSGNVIGGGDWGAERVIPDCVRAASTGGRITLRNPGATRPWQHVLEPLGGYLLLAERLSADRAAYAGAWNFGPAEHDVWTVERLVQRFCALWGEGLACETVPGQHPHEANLLKLDCSKAGALLGWRPRWPLETALEKVASWTRAWRSGADLAAACREQIGEYGSPAPKSL